MLEPRAVALAALAASSPAFAQGTDWPTKPVKFISPFPPGGSVDPLARLVAAKMSEALGQQFIVENKTGASGSIGTAFVAKAPPDGYTYVFVFDTHAVNPTLIPNLPFDTLKDLAPVMLIGTSAMAITTNAGKPYKTFSDVIAAAKAKPGAISYGSVGAGSLGHLIMTLLQQAAGIQHVHIPYKGGGPMTTDVLGGQIELAIASVAQQGPHVRGGKLRALIAVIRAARETRENFFQEKPQSGGCSSRCAAPAGPCARGLATGAARSASTPPDAIISALTQNTANSPNADPIVPNTSGPITRAR